MTPTSSSSAPRQPARRRSVRHLVASLAVAALAIGGAALAPQSTGALYGATATTTLAGFQVQSLCLFDSYESVPDRLDALAPSVHWGFDPESADEGWTAAGDPLPEAVAPDGTLLCDDGVIELTAGQVVSSDAPLTSPATTVLVLGTPSYAGVVLSLFGAGGRVDVIVDDGSVTARSWVDDDAPVPLATGSLDEGLVHVLAVTIDGGQLTLWADGTGTTEPLPPELVGTVGGAGLGLGVVEPDAGETATFVATELAVVGGTLATSALEAIHEAAVPGP